LEESSISCDLGTGRVSETVEAPKLEEFPVEPVFEANPVPMPESFPRRFVEAMGCSSSDVTRYILQGVQLDVSGPADAGHYLVGTDGRNLSSANSFTLPLAESITIPSHKLLLWRGLTEIPWALAGQKNKDNELVRIAAGDWTLTMKTIEGTYPNWRQVVPHFRQHNTTVTLPEDHEFSKIANGLTGTLWPRSRNNSSTPDSTCSPRLTRSATKGTATSACWRCPNRAFRKATVTAG